MVWDSFSVNLCFLLFVKMNIESMINSGNDIFVIFLISDCVKLYFFVSGFTEMFSIRLPSVCCILNSKIAQYKTANIPESRVMIMIFVEETAIND